MADKRRKRGVRQSGFTIVELLIVIVIIGILAALVIIAYTGIQDRASETKNKTNAQAVLRKVEAYAADNQSYYPTLAEIQAATGVAKLDQGLSALVTDQVPAGTTAATKARIQVRNCDAGAGVKINYWMSSTGVVSPDIDAGTTTGVCS